MNAEGKALPAPVVDSAHPDLEAVFVAHFAPVLRLVTRVVRDQARAEDLTVDVFLKWASCRSASADLAAGWLYRAAVRLAIDELRRRTRRTRYERLMTALSRTPETPEDLHAAAEEQQKVRGVLASLRRRDAELLVLRSHGLQYNELASALQLNPASVGTLLARAQRAFRTEYVRRHGEQ